MKHTRWIAATAAAVLIAGGTALGVALPAAADDAPPAAQTEGSTSSPESTPAATDSQPEMLTSSPESSTADTDSQESSSPAPENSSATVDSAPVESSKSSTSAGTSSPANPPKHDPITLCHQPNTPAQQTLTVDDSAAKGHLKHGDTLGVCPTPVEGWWLMPDGGTAEHVTWPQTATDPGNVPCGVTAQVDTYPSQAVLDQLRADGVLKAGEDSAVVMSWRFVYGGDCKTPVVGLPSITVTPPGCAAGERHNVIHVTVPEGLTVNGFASGDYIAEDLGVEGDIYHEWTVPVVVADGYSYDGPTTLSFTLTAPPTGYQVTDPEGQCYVPPAADKVEHEEYSTDACTQPLDGTRTVTLWADDVTIPQLFDPETGTFSDGERVQGDAYVVDTKTVNDSDCAAPVIPPVTPPAPPSAAQPVTLAAAPVAPVESFGTLAQTGSNVDVAYLGVAAAVLLIALGLGVWGGGVAVRRHRAFRTVMRRLSQVK